VWFWIPDDGPDPPEAWTLPGFRPAGEAARGGRGGARRIELPTGERLWWREYRRGGWSARLRSRAFRSDRRLRGELRALRLLAEGGVPVPPPFLGRVERVSGGLHLVLVTRDLGGRSLLEAVLEAANPRAALALCREAGRTVRRMQDLGFRHPDLHPGNLQVGEDGRVHVLDLAGGSFASPGEGVPDPAALVRCARFLRKHRGRDPSPRELCAFLQGFEPEASRRRALLPELRRRYLRQVRLRRLLWRRPRLAPPAFPREPLPSEGQ